ncbi:MobF family relaxase [Nocardioides psychrotolerans]|uniref:MobF family relaxase n=1 Tax=Nocardioides psychrotolerans TaxID=1005945 RepID=UPI001FEAB1E9|nr:MobF family relaxase [Nocardioides psychrotolerans]
MKVYRGNPAAARSYVEADHARVDDYYLAEGTGLAMRFVATPDGVEAVGALDGDGYEAWVAGIDPLTGEPRGRLRQDASAVRFVEVVVNGPKTWSLAAALDPAVAVAYDAAQDRAAGEIIGWLAQHATTRVGPRGRQVQVPVERIEAATVRHYTSRAGDPHRHLHVQINARVWAAGKWRGLHTVGVRDMIDAVNGIGHAAVMCDPQFRQVLADRGFSVDAKSGEVNELAGFVGAFSARARQIGQNIARYEAAWRDTHSGQEPGPELLRTWDRRAWSQARPDKVVPTDGTVLTDRWVDELHRLGFRTPTHGAALNGVRTGALDRDAAVTTVLTRLGAKRSGWNGADIRGQVELLIAGEGIVTDRAVRIELAEDLTARAVAACVPLLDEEGTPEHIRALTSATVLGVEADLNDSFAVRASLPGLSANITGGDLDEAQMRAVATLAGKYRLVVVEGAAGAGKTATLAGTASVVAQTGHRMIVVTPTLKAAHVAETEAGVQAHSAAWLAHQYGYAWDNNGCWTRGPSDPSAQAVLGRGDLLLIDEAGMLDQDTAHALIRIVDETGARLALVGDRHQLPAVGRGGVLDLAARWVDPEARLMLDTVHRFVDPDYAKLSLAMRAGENPAAVFDQLVGRGEIVLHPDEASRTAVLADGAAATGALVVADTREQVADLNQAIRERLVTAGKVDDSRVLITDGGERLGVGDRVATRRNDRDLNVANRDTWTVSGLRDNGTMHLVGVAGTREVPYGYAVRDVELAYASTVYGAQGETTRSAHLVLGEHTGAASAYVAMTRGREANTAHVVAEDLHDARQQWALVFSRDRADLGPAHAGRLAAEAAAKYERYDHPAHTEGRNDPAPVARRHREPPPSYSRPSRGGPGIGF